MAEQFVDCPKCHGEMIGGNVEMDGDAMWREVECESCGFAYVEVYRFSANETSATAVELNEQGDPIDLDLDKHRRESFNLGDIK